MKYASALGALVALGLLVPESLDAWCGGILGVLNHHGKLAKRAESCQRECTSQNDPGCIPLPRPLSNRCEQEVDDSSLFRALRIGSSEPDRSDGLNSPKHSFNPEHKPEWDSSIREVLNLSASAEITPGTALEAIEDEKKKTRKRLSEITCSSTLEDYKKVWKQFGRLSHYPADLASPLHAYSVGIDEVYHEGDRDKQERWYRGLWDIGGKLMHGHLEIGMGRAAEFESLECNSLSPETVAWNARAVMTEYRALTEPATGYEGLVRDFKNGEIAAYYFFTNIGPQQARDALGGILHAWRDVLKDFKPPSNCRRGPPIGCGDCGGGECRPPGGDHPDDFEGLPGSSRDFTSQELLDQSWDRLAVKKNKRSLVWFWMQDYLLWEYRTGTMDEETYLALSNGYELSSEVAWELFHEDYVTAPDVAILGRGFALSMSDLIQGTFNEPIRRYKPDNFSPEALANYPLLIIPSGGLVGLENSSFFKANLEEYVRLGGTLIVFAQQHGYEFSILPVPEEADGSRRKINGYGWAEDHSCFRGAAFIDTWHQILASISKATPDLNVDGYFTEYPSNSTILLRRTANGQPAMLMYEFGLGRVIVTSMYSDFASEHNQASSEEKALVRDIITWAKSPQMLPQVRPGQDVTLDITAVNQANRDASAIKLRLYDPNRSVLLGEQTLDMPVPAGGSSSIQATFPTQQKGPVGIYHVDYVLLDSKGIIVQPEAETDSGRFVASNPPADSYRSPDFSFSVQSDREHYLPGSSVHLTFNLWNNTDTDRQITTRFILPHNNRREENTSMVPARGHSSFTYVLEPVRNTDRVWAYFRDEQGKNGGFAAKGIWVVVPNADLGLQLEKSRYEKGESVLIDWSVANKVVLGWPAEVRLAIMNAQGELVFQDSRSLDLPAHGSTTFTNSFTIPQTAAPGTYSVSLETLYRGKRVSTSWTRFDVPESKVEVKPQLPPRYNSGLNIIPFTITNRGQINVRNGTLEINLKEPGGSLVWSETLPFTLAVRETKTLDVPVVFPPIKLGTYVLSYAQSDETRTGSPTELRITNNSLPVISARLEKTSYRARDTAFLTVSLVNNGLFALDQVPLTARLAGTTQTQTSFVSLPPGESSQVAFSLYIPPDIAPGNQRIEVEAILSPQAVLRKEVGFQIPHSRLLVTYSGSPTPKPGEVIPLTIQNQGGVDTAYTAQNISLTSPEGLTIWEGNTTGEILCGETKILAEIPVPEQAAGGPVNLRARVKDGSTQEIILLDRSLRIEGLRAGLETRTNQDVYLLTDSASALTSLTNGPLELKNGVVTVTVSRMVPSLVWGFQVHYPKSIYEKWISRPQTVAVAGDGRLFVPEADKNRLWEYSPAGETQWKDIWNGFSEPRGIMVSEEGSIYIVDAGYRQVLKYQGGFWADQFGSGFQFLEPSGIALGPQGYIYVVDSGLHQVLKFDLQGNAVGQWGDYGQSQGQMISPRGIAASQDGHILVADTGNHRIQVFDVQGNFVFAFGEQGAEQGRFSNPQGVALGPEGYIYVADTGNNRIQVFDREGNFIFAWGEPGTAEGQLLSPSGLAISLDGTIYVADTLNSRIQAFDGSGNHLFSWVIGYCEPTCGACQEIYWGYCDYQWDYCKEKELFYCQDQHDWPAWFEWGSAMAASQEWTIYAFNPYRHVIQELDISYGEVTVLNQWGQQGSGEGQFQDPKGMALSPDGSIYVADTGNNRVERFDRDGNFLGSWGSEGEGQGEFRSPEAIAVSGDGKVYVADTGNHRIQIFNSDGMFLVGWGQEGQAHGEFSSPRGIAVGPTGYVYVADTGNNRIQRFDLEGRFLGEFGTAASGPGELSLPTGIAVGTWGSVYVIDSGNKRVVRFDRDGNFQGEWTDYQCDYGITDNCSQTFEALNSIASGPYETIYLADGERFYISLNRDEGAEKILETTHPVSLSSGETREFTDLTGPLSTPGKYLLEASVRNSLAQVLARATYPFYVAEQDIVLTLEPERKIYRPGELIRISGSIQNRAPANAGGLKLYLLARDPSGQMLELFSQSLELQAGGNFPISVSMIAGEEGSIVLTGVVLHHDKTLLELQDQLEVEVPKVYQSLDVPQVAGEEPFPIRVNLANHGRLPVWVNLEIKEKSGQTILTQGLSLQGGENRSLETFHQIQSDTDLSFVFTGDLSGLEVRKVFYGLGAEIHLFPQAVYSEGPVAVEVSLANTGLLEEVLTLNYQVSPGAIEIVRSYALLPGQKTSDVLYFVLPEASYAITASCAKPHMSAQGFFQVRRQNRVELNLSTGVGGGGIVPISAQVSNLGANELGLNVLAEVTDASGANYWNGGKRLPVVIPGSSELIDFQIPITDLAVGAYTARVSVLSTSGEPLASQEVAFTVKPALIQMIQSPTYQTFQPGQEAIFRFWLKNSGDQGSSFNLRVQVEDLLDSSEQGWLGAGEEKEVFFGTLLPEDLDQRDHWGTWELSSSGPLEKGIVRFATAGLALQVTPSLDKSSYGEGDTARLTLHVQTSAATALPLMAQVNYNGFEENRPFMLAGSQSLIFEIPLPKITGEKLFFGIYHESGRSIYLNAISIKKTEELIHLSTDRHIYRAGDTVVVTVEGQAVGNMTLSGPGGYSESFSFTGFTSRSLVLPSVMTAGTYEVSARLRTADSQLITASQTFDVAGIRVKVREAALDKPRYGSADTINLSLWMESNESLEAIIRTWIMDPQGEYSEAGQIGVTLTNAEPVPARLSFPFTTTVLGIHRLAYAISLGDMLLCSGSEAFDVGSALLLGVRTEKVEYPTNTEPVQVEASFLGEGEGTLEILVDGVSQGMMPVTLHGGTSNARFTIPNTSAGSHKVRAVLEVEGLTSFKETSFLYGTRLPDLSVELMGNLEVGHPPQAALLMEIRNQGRENAPATTLALYEEAEARLLASFEVAPLAPGQIQSFSHQIQLTGSPGPRTFVLKADPQAQVEEFQKENNEARLTITLPEVSILTDTERGTYYPGETMQIVTRIFNFATLPLEGLSLETIVRNQAGAEVFSQTTVFNIASASELSLEVNWPIPGGLPLGTYVLQQQVAGKSPVSEKTFTLSISQQEPFFTLFTETPSIKVEAGETASWVITVNPASGFEGEVALSVTGSVPNCALVVTPDLVQLSGGLAAQATLKVITTSQSAAGVYSLSLMASSGGNQSSIQVTLEVADFSVSITPFAESVKQLDKATFTIKTNPLGGFDGPVRFSLSGIPEGVKAQLSTSQAAVGQEVTLEVFTSKWVLPGDYYFEVTARGRTASHGAQGKLTVEINPALSPSILTSCFRDRRGRPIIKSFTPEGDWIKDYKASSKAGVVSLASGDLDGDGLDELVVATTRKGIFSQAKIRVLGRDGGVLSEASVDHRGLLHPPSVAIGDLDGDWKEEIIVGISSLEESLGDLDDQAWWRPVKGSTVVKAYKLLEGRLVETGLRFVPFPEPWAWRAPNLAVGDIDGDGRPELIAAPGSAPMAPALVRVFQVETPEPMQWEVGSLKAEWEVNFTSSQGTWVGYGANVAAADLDCDGRDEIIVGAPRSPRAMGQVAVIRAESQEEDNEPFLAFPEGRGVFVAGGDVDGDGCAEIVAGQGPSPRAGGNNLLFFKGDGSLLSGFRVECQPARAGVRVAVGALGDGTPPSQ